HYHKAPHASHFGRTPADVYESAARPTDGIDEQKLRDALTVRARRRVRRDSTLPLDGTDWETDQGWLAGRLVTVAQCLVDPEAPFSKEIPDTDLWLPPSKQALCAELVEALGERQSVLLVGEPGVGKTCVLRALRHQLPQAGFRLTYCANATLGRRDFYRMLC